MSLASEVRSFRRSLFTPEVRAGGASVRFRCGSAVNGFQRCRGALHLAAAVTQSAAAARLLVALHLHHLPRILYAWSASLPDVTCCRREPREARMETAADAPAAAEPPAVVCCAAFPVLAILARHGQERADIFHTMTLRGTCTAGRPQAQTRREEGCKEGAQGPQGREGRGEEEYAAMAGAAAITRSSSPVAECPPECSPALR